MTIRTIPNKESTLLLVEDNGKGIDIKGFGDKIFDLYKTFHQMEYSGGQIRMCSEVRYR
ncbi:hypothetical protein [Aureicoccus marinus]|uniref:hypothetical protein n=1 Tax=Aureicoccus marinus TaxID=754435 RepID=UPI0015E391C9|nr:hypothetical protein [Aureicoccus marinus]